MNVLVKKFKKFRYILNSKKKVLGKLIVLISKIITGKYKINYKNNYNIGDYIYLLNTDFIKFLKLKNKKNKYYKHTGYPGGLKLLKFSYLFKNKRETFIKKSIKKMLKKNKIVNKLIKNFSLKKNIKDIILMKNFKILNI